jgi:hypothetical protein
MRPEVVLAGAMLVQKQERRDRQRINVQRILEIGLLILPVLGRNFLVDLQRFGSLRACLCFI